MRIELTDNPAPEDKAAIQDQIRVYNRQMSPAHRASTAPDGWQHLALFLRDDSGAILGGLVGLTYWDWLEIEYFWVQDELRGRGYGHELLRRAEAEARRRGCQHAYLETFSFQAHDFYGARGYRVVGALEDYPPGETFYWMRKEL